MDIFLKDDKLAYIHNQNLGNIAQFISIDPTGKVKHVFINQLVNSNFDVRQLVMELIKSSKSKGVNIRSFSLLSMKGNQLIYNKTIEDIDYIMLAINKNCAEGKYSIINENIDINDGGISGVILGNVIEFAPKDTPKCVDKKGVCVLEKKLGYHMLKTVYGFEPNLNFDKEHRVEFSIHPSREGVNKKHTIVWEYEKFENINQNLMISWPNRFSEFIGDKTFGLIIADYLGLDVPYTTVISREVAPFTFGKKTGLLEKWIRTSPIIKEPGKYYTGKQWTDPFLLIEQEEAKGELEINIASLLSQDAVDALYSGGAIVYASEDDDIIEGVNGVGENFMLGCELKSELPAEVKREVMKINNILRTHINLLGRVSIEWVYDGNKVWVVQLNQLKCSGCGNIIVKGNPKYYEKFNVNLGLEELRKAIQILRNKDIGIELVGNIGITSHFGDLLRQANIPSRISGN